MLYRIKVEAYFSSAHNLRGYRGKCEALHGHNWKVEVSVAKDKLGETGMVLDFEFLKKKLNKILEKLDHRYLNDLTYFKKVNPTSENIAEFIFKNLRRQIPGVSAVTVWENNTCSATYEE